MIRGSIYDTQALESIFKKMFPNQYFFGIRQNSDSSFPHSPRVAVTTTVQPATAMYLVNYNRGGSHKAEYLYSVISTWEV